MHTSKFAEVSSGSDSDIVPSRQPQLSKLFSSIQDIGELLRFDCAQKQEMGQLGPQFHHRRAKAGELIYRLGQPSGLLYIVRFGFLKVVLRNFEGDERVLSFPMKGNLLGFDGIYRHQYSTEAIALTDCELISIPFKQLLTRDNSCRELERMIYMAISRECFEWHAGINLPSPCKSEVRVARFLEELVKRYAAIGYSSKRISLPMTRRDIGGYLGLTLETVSRSLSALAATKAISAHRKNIEILQPELLHLFHDSFCRQHYAAGDRVEKLFVKSAGVFATPN